MVYLSITLTLQFLFDFTDPWLMFAVCMFEAGGGSMTVIHWLEVADAKWGSHKYLPKFFALRLCTLF